MAETDDRVVGIERWKRIYVTKVYARTGGWRQLPFAPEQVGGHFVTKFSQIPANFRSYAGDAADPGVAEVRNDERYFHCSASQSKMVAHMRSMSASVIAWKDGNVTPREDIESAFGNGLAKAR